MADFWQQEIKALSKPELLPPGSKSYKLSLKLKNLCQNVSLINWQIIYEY